jgi:hypothetical protein
MRQTLSRRLCLEALAAAIVSAGSPGCGSHEHESVKQQGPEDPGPTLGWETIAEGDAGPGPRSRHGLVYDDRAKAAVLFGGIVWKKPVTLRSDTWELRGHDWIRIKASQSPAPRHRGAMVYLGNAGRSILFGGQGTKGQMFGDTWAYSGGDWQLLNPAGPSPIPRCGHSFAVDEHAGVAVLFGGIQAGDKPLGDTWVFDGVAWKQVAGAAPSARRYAAFAFDPDLKGCLLHGGSEDDHGQRMFGDAWLFRDNTWSALGSNFKTEPRDDHSLAYHRVAKRLVMLKGLSGKRGILVRESDGWRHVEARPLHPRHQCSPLAWDDDLGGLLLYGGEERHGGPQYDTTLLLRMPPAT